MTEPIKSREIEIRDLFPTFSDEQLEAKRTFLFGYFDIALKVLERMEREEKSGH